MENRQSQTILSMCGIAAPVVSALLVIIAGAYYPGYSHVTRAISELGGAGAQHPLIQDVNFFITGVLIVAFALGLYRHFDGAVRSAVGAGLTSLVLWIALAKVGGIQVMNGSLQRVFAGTIFLWIGVISARLLVRSRS
jgi:hypothetical membrane protein